MSTTFTATFNSTHPNNTCIDDLQANTNTLRSMYSATVAPANATPGQGWMDTSATPDVPKRYMDTGAGNVWQEVGTFLSSDVDFNSNQAKDFRAENVTSSDTPAAGNVGQIKYRTDNSQLEIVRDSGTLDKVVHGNTGHFVPEWIPAGSWEDDASNPPTAVTVGTTPTIRGKLFNATNELVSAPWVVPDGFSDTADCKLRVWFYLNAAFAANSTVNLNVDLISASAGDLATRTSTNATVVYDIGNASLQYALHSADVPIDYDDASNPLDAGDLVEFELSMGGIASVSAIIFRGAQVLAPFGGTTLETS